MFLETQMGEQMKILTPGGYGLIGHNVVQRLKQLGHTVSIIDNKTN